MNKVCRNVKNFTAGLQQESQLVYIVRDLCSLFLNFSISLRSYFVDEKRERSGQNVEGQGCYSGGPGQAGKMG